MANSFNQFDRAKPKAPRASICDHCNSKGYCRNKAPGMIACENFNRFPKHQDDPWA